MNLKLDFTNREQLNITDIEFLSAFRGPNEKTYFRMIQEQGYGAKKLDSTLRLDDELEYPLTRKHFEKAQREGYGIYFVVNSGGTTKKSIKRVNAHFLDMDFGKVPKIVNGEILLDSNGKVVYEYRSHHEVNKYKTNALKNLNRFELCPNIIVETKNGFHVYWLVKNDSDNSLKTFTALQEKLIKYFARFEEREEHIDANVKDLSRVLRVINYNHLKDLENPFKIKCIHFDNSKKYTQDDIANAIGYKVATPSNKKTINKKTKTHNLKTYKPNQHGTSSTISYENLIPFLKSQNLVDFLGLDSELNVNFNCVFHKDSKPSAVITYRNGAYRYFCNSTNCQFKNGADIIDIVEYKENLTTSQAISHLIEYFDIKNIDSSWISKQTKKIDTNIYLITQIEKDFPKLNRIIRFGFQTLITILEISKENTYNRYFSVDDDNLFFFSNGFLAKKLKKSTGNVNKYVNLFCTLGLLNKIPYSKVNVNLQKKAKEMAKSNGYIGISFYTVPDYNRILKIANERAEKMLRYGFSINGMSKKFVVNCFGEALVNQIYHTNIKESRKSEKISRTIEDFILQQIKSCGYFTKSMLINRQLQAGGNYIRRGEKEYELKRILPDVMQKYNLSYIKANKKVNKALGIDTKKYLLVKEDILDA
ncbi:hypothetical protein PRVXT_000237 [Proteinivorax tanatarense]|uniref:Uncharacterized protein n=1 Tax=Proteinivorax tanatarense TaxID=1260629 RepID=A0AAU7VLX3_9FIRM